MQWPHTSEQCIHDWYHAGAFENTVQALYKYVVPKPKSECSKGEQLLVSFGAGYIAGVLCAAISQPADNLVSKMNAQKGVPVGTVAFPCNLSVAFWHAE